MERGAHGKSLKCFSARAMDFPSASLTISRYRDTLTSEGTFVLARRHLPATRMLAPARGYPGVIRGKEGAGGALRRGVRVFTFLNSCINNMGGYGPFIFRSVSDILQLFLANKFRCNLTTYTCVDVICME